MSNKDPTHVLNVTRYTRNETLKLLTLRGTQEVTTVYYTSKKNFQYEVIHLNPRRVPFFFHVNVSVPFRVCFLYFPSKGFTGVPEVKTPGKDFGSPEIWET